MLLLRYLDRIGSGGFIAQKNGKFALVNPQESVVKTFIDSDLETECRYYVCYLYFDVLDK